MIILNEPYANLHSPTDPNTKKYIKDIINLESSVAEKQKERFCYSAQAL